MGDGGRMGDSGRMRGGGERRGGGGGGGGGGGSYGSNVCYRSASQKAFSIIRVCPYYLSFFVNLDNDMMSELCNLF